MPDELARPDDVAAASMPPGVESFSDRARHLVAFLATRDPGAATRRREEDLADWIAHWRLAPMRGIDAAHHFVSEELGIIARALNGPANARPGLGDHRNQSLCWLLARCISDPN